MHWIEQPGTSLPWRVIRIKQLPTKKTKTTSSPTSQEIRSTTITNQKPRARPNKKRRIYLRRRHAIELRATETEQERKTRKNKEKKIRKREKRREAKKIGDAGDGHGEEQQAEGSGEE